MNAALLNKAIDEKLRAGTALVALLAPMKGGTAPAIYQGRAVEGQPYPYVVYSWQGGGQTNLVPDLQDRVEFIRAYGTSGLQAGSADALINTLMHGATLTVSGWSTVTVMREDDYETVETPPSGVPVYTMGGLYRIVMDT